MYDVVVSNTCDTVISAGAVLPVEVPPTITADPAAERLCSGEAVTLNVTWRRGNEAIMAKATEIGRAEQAGGA